MGRFFNVTKDHLKLMKRMHVGWNDCETGAPEIDPKRPYGNSSVELDVAEILGWKVDEDGLTEVQEITAMRLHRETGAVLQIALSVGYFKVGAYKLSDEYGVEWEKA